MTVIGPLAFGAPWVLFGLVVLPVIWWLLRVTPPTAKKVRFPAVRLLLGLQQSEETPARTPLWLLLLRVAIAALVILALADPYVNPQATASKAGPIVIAVDNSWAAAARWDDRVSAMQSIAVEAERDRRAIIVLPTAKSDAAAAPKKMTGAEAQGAIKAVAPQPFGTDRLKAVEALEKLSLSDRPDIVWLSDGLEDSNSTTFVSRLTNIGKLRSLNDNPSYAALALTQPRAEGNALIFRVVRATPGPEIKGALKVLGQQGRHLASQDFVLAAGATDAKVSLEVATELRNDITRIEIANRTSAGGTILADERWKRRPVGMVSGQSVDAAQPLLSDLFYLERALQPYSEIHKGQMQELIKSGISVLILADVGQVTGDERRAVSDWVAQGGVLIRFSGPRLAAKSDDMIPGKLRTGGRLLGSAMAWDKPQSLSAWPEDSPFAGLKIPEDVLVKRQVLTDPSSGSGVLTWAQLNDGTPLVTAVRQSKGWIVLFHVTANASWSSLPISGLFVDMLRRVVSLSIGLSGETSSTKTSTGPLVPAESLDGYGNLNPPPASARPLKPEDFEATAPGPQHPPGFYGEGGSRRALNLFKHEAMLSPIGALSKTIQSAEYGLNEAIELKYSLMSAAILLALFDLIAALLLRGLIALPEFKQAKPALSAALIAAMVATMLLASQAQADDSFALKASLNYRLAYVQTGDPDVDEMSKAGLRGLTRALKERTAVDPAEPIAINIETDELAFFPLLYWPVSPAQPSLSATALAKVDMFMRNGGTILFDTRDHDTSLPVSMGAAASGSITLRRLMAGLDLPPLQPLSQEHVLSRTFYLLREYPGRWESGKVWIEGQQLDENGAAKATASDGVSPIIVGAADWAAAWAEDVNGRPIAAVVPGGERQRELAMRFGINLVMYTLTGNYKADLVHVPHILERLGQ